MSGWILREWRRADERLPRRVDGAANVGARAQEVVVILVAPRRDERIGLRDRRGQQEPRGILCRQLALTDHLARDRQPVTDRRATLARVVGPEVGGRALVRSERLLRVVYGERVLVHHRRRV